MTENLQQFVFDTLREWGATKTELAPGVWRVQLAEGDQGQAAWFLGRPTGELLITFDLSRWEEGARLECLTPLSPLVRRMQMLTEGRGVFATVTMVADRDAIERNGHRYQAYLLCRFSGRYSNYRVVEERRWLGMSLATGVSVKVAGDPLSADGIVEGEPESGVRISPVMDPSAALDNLTEMWEEQVSHRARTLINESESAYLAEAEEAMRVLEGEELDERIETIAHRYAPVVESNLEAAILLWR